MSVNRRFNNQTCRYGSPKRRQQASGTLRRFLAAVARLFAGRAAVIGALAEEIGVASELSAEQVMQGADAVEQLRVGAGTV